MRDVKEELERLREKLRRMERSLDSTPSRALENPRQDTPPWDASHSEGLFESSLERQSSDGGPLHGLQLSEEIDQSVAGRFVSTPKGTHFESDTLFRFGENHGQFNIAELSQVPAALLQPLCPDHRGDAIERWAFLDTETTGLAGGAGTFAFLIGLGFVTAEGFLVRQYFLREPSEEHSVLFRLAEDLSQFSTLITYNGRGYDAPLLETRYRLARERVPFEAMPHLDLLHACRRLWKLRFESCKLTYLEERILGHERVGDVPGFLIPSLYMNYLRSRDARSLVPVFTHNALDILSLACLTSVVGSVFVDPTHYQFRHGTECIGLGRWLMQAGRKEEALHLFRGAINGNIPEELLARTLWDIFQIERQSQRFDAARESLEQIIGFPNAHHAKAMEALSILFEHRLKDLSRAIHFARRLEELQPGEKSGLRLERLVKKQEKGRRGRIFEST